MQETPVPFPGQEDLLQKGKVTHSGILGLPPRIHPQCRRPEFDPWVGKMPWRRERLPTPVFRPEEFHECIVHGVTKSWIPLSGFHFHFQRWRGPLAWHVPRLTDELKCLRRAETGSQPEGLPSPQRQVWRLKALPLTYRRVGNLTDGMLVFREISFPNSTK